MLQDTRAFLYFFFAVSSSPPHSLAIFMPFCGPCLFHRDQAFLWGTYRFCTFCRHQHFGKIQLALRVGTYQHFSPRQEKKKAQVLIISNLEAKKKKEEKKRNSTVGFSFLLCRWVLPSPWTRWRIVIETACMTHLVLRQMAATRLCDRLLHHSVIFYSCRNNGHK